MQINQRFVRSEHSRAQVALTDRHVANKKYFVCEGLHARPCACFFEERVELPQIYVIKSCRSRFYRPGTSNIEQHGTDRDMTRTHRNEIFRRDFLPFRGTRVRKKYVALPIESERNQIGCERERRLISALCRMDQIVMADYAIHVC